MKNLILIVAFLSVVAWAIPKSMESITNYNVMMLHGALGSDKGFKPDESIPEAAYDDYRGSGHIGKYGDHKDRVTYWLSRNVFKEPDWDDIKDAVRASSIYAWRSFTNPANTSLNNAHEMGDRMWNAKIDGYSKFGKRRALFEEAQEVRAFEVVYQVVDCGVALRRIAETQLCRKAHAHKAAFAAYAVDNRIRPPLLHRVLLPV